MEREEAPDPSDDSSALLAAAHRGDRDALEALLVRHLPQVRVFVRLQVSPFLRAREADSDIVQSVCIEVLQRAERFDYRGEAAFRSWLYRAVLHKIRDRERYYRARKRAPPEGTPAHEPEQLVEHYQSLCSPSRVAIGAERVRLVEEAFGRLPPRYAEVLALVRLAGLSRNDAARELGTTPGAVSTLLRRATVRLSRVLEQLEEESRDA